MNLPDVPADNSTGPVVWILSKGERYEGGWIVGVYLDRDLARGALVTLAQELHDRFEISDARQNDDGSIHVEGGCDWISLVPHPVVTAAQIEAGA
ncbi:hypothetical protein E6R18_24940 [Streptomyces sp. A1277]|uniref:hypothetical protein n=1 Tax=Streptomyces sp. A1277 TaxID=2563103 RepID=UPI0010A28A7E|nr:hypothetical protein [Streptomyces sp. A1277]THA29161.1 hypothetical protein E6R18_24940 [Streptomyces sp. A1277]